MRKVLLIVTLSLTMGLTGCSSKENNKPNDENGSTKVDSKKELTPLEKEISELVDWQVTDKVYENKDLEPFNKMQGYLYSVNEASGKGAVEVIELTPPTAEGLAELEKYGQEYNFIDNVIIPCYFELTSEKMWVKRYPVHMNEDIKTYWFRADPEYLYATQEELNDVFSSNEEVTVHQFVK